MTADDHGGVAGSIAAGAAKIADTLGLGTYEDAHAPTPHHPQGGSKSEKADHGKHAPAEIHQKAGAGHPNMTTNFGVVVADDQNSLRAGARGPTLLEDFILREKIFHFDHERIPERVVHARGYAAHGYFEVTNPIPGLSRAAVFKSGERTPVFLRFSTVAGNEGSPDLARDVRGFAVKFYTKEGNWDLVGNNIPVFFIQDAIKFPDLIHAAKQEPDRGFPQAQTAHDTFWDFISLTPESMHMVMWAMSDRGIPRSFRMMEGFGIHAFRLINDAGDSTFVKFHWRPKLGMQSVVWDEALKINGADPDFHRRDLWNSIEMGDYPEWELAIQVLDDEVIAKFPFDILDSTKLIPEEIAPLQVVGRMVLDRNVDNFFAETEQVAFCTQNVVPGIDFSDDPLLQGRNFSYLDTQLKRLGSPNFQNLPVNAPKCPFANFQRDGHMQTQVPKGRVAYEPNSLSSDGPRENPKLGYSSYSAQIEGPKVRHRSETFADHYSQARQFFDSQTPPEQNHIISALIFETSKVETKRIRGSVLAQLANIRPEIAHRVADGIGWTEEIKPAPAARPVRTDLPPSPALSILAKAKKTFKGRKLGILVGDGADQAEVDALKAAVKAEGGVTAVIAPKVGGAKSAGGGLIEADFQLAGGPSVLFDAVAVVVGEQAGQTLAKTAAAVSFVHDAFAHLKVIGHSAGAKALLQAAGVTPDEGVVALNGAKAEALVEAAAGGRIWAREPNVRPVF